MQNYIRINVARKESDGRYHHFFATGETLATERDAREVFLVFKEKFPFPEYSITVTHEMCKGVVLNWNEDINDSAYNRKERY